MDRPRLALKLLAWADSSGAREALIGDLIEEVADGRSCWWLYHQLIGLYGVAIAAHVREHARPTPQLVALSLCVMLFGGVSVASLGSVLETWLGFYLVAGTVSLFAHMGFRANDERRSVIPADAKT